MLHQWHAALGGAILQSFFQIALLGVLAACVLACIDRRRASLRHGVGMVFLLAMAAAPVASLLRPATAVLMQADAAWHPVAVPITTVDVLPLAHDAALPIPLWLAWCWYAGVSIMLARLALGLRELGRMGRQAADALPASWQRRVAHMARAMGIGREVRVLLSHGVGTPCTAHAWRPLVWLPARMLTSLPQEQLEAVIAHELAHIRRLDWLWNGLQRAVEAMLFYHPAVWWLSRQISRDREHACDDLAVSACADPIALAEALVSLERERRPLLLAAGGGSLRQRVARLLAVPQARPARWQGSVLSAGIAGSVLLLSAQASLAGPAPTAKPTPEEVARVQVVNPAAHIDIDGGNIHIIETEKGEKREYIHSESWRGKVSESYAVNDKPATIDAAVRQWVADRVKKATPLPPEPPAPPVVLDPPEPPQAPQPPAMSDSLAYKEAVRLAMANPLLAQRLGTAIRAGQDIHGSLHEHSSEGKATGSADLYISLQGSLGSSTLHAVGEKVNGGWQFRQLDLEPDASHEVLHLAAAR